MYLERTACLLSVHCGTYIVSTLQRSLKKPMSIFSQHSASGWYRTTYVCVYVKAVCV